MNKTLRTIALVTSISLVGSTLLQAEEAKKKPAKDPKAAFEKLDADKNGSISKEEFSAPAKDPAKAEAAFAKKDANQDGSLSPEEFSAGGPKKDKAAKKPKAKKPAAKKEKAPAAE